MLIRTWKKLVEPRVMMGERTSLFETTCIRNTSAMDRLRINEWRLEEFTQWHGVLRSKLTSSQSDTVAR